MSLWACNYQFEPVFLPHSITHNSTSLSDTEISQRIYGPCFLPLNLCLVRVFFLQISLQVPSSKKTPSKFSSGFSFFPISFSLSFYFTDILVYWFLSQFKKNCTPNSVNWKRMLCNFSYTQSPNFTCIGFGLSVKIPVQTPMFKQPVVLFEKVERSLGCESLLEEVDHWRWSLGF